MLGFADKAHAVLSDPLQRKEYECGESDEDYSSKEWQTDLEHLREILALAYFRRIPNLYKTSLVELYDLVLFYWNFEGDITFILDHI